ncbi:MAG: hypothetical protein AMJ88_16630 [Anaerolineae bacterium SM23_ 63]|nr:MAG: hypothetical protein AMJ88_16630 [Anaerolineae bacterium SM23_ 63]
MRRSILFILALTVMGMLSGCGTTNGNTSSSGNDAQAPSRASQGDRLGDDYADALSIQGQLAAGILLLEDTDLAVDEALAEELLPLWRAAQSLMNSDRAAKLEIEAVYNQIQDTMTPDQISAIAEMALTEDSLTTMMEEGKLFSGQVGFVRGRGNSTGGEGFIFTPPEGGFQGGPFVFSQEGPGEGPRGGFAEGMNPEVMATRQVQVAGNNLGNFQDQMLIMAVIRTLEMKTGEISQDQAVRPFDMVYNVIAETTGLSIEEIRAQAAEGITLAEIVETNGGDLEQVRNSLIEVLSELPNAADLDLELLVSEWLGLDE